MLRSSIAFVLLLVPVLALAQPKLVVDPEEFDLGVLKQNETRDFSVTITNAGDQPLVIEDIESTCGCTVPELAVTELAPGQSTAMAIHFNSKTFQGKQTKYVHVFSNDPHRSAVDLIITADIQVPLRMTPAKAMIGFRTLQVGETQTLTYTFTSEDVDELEMEPRSWPRDWLDVAVKPGRSPHTTLVDFTIRADAPPGRHREQIKLSTNVPDAPLVTLQADVKVISDLVVNPEKVNLRVLRPEQPLKTHVRVAPYRPGTAFEITGASVDIPGIRARVENGDGECVVWLDGQSLAAGDERVESNGAVKGTLTIMTNLASSPQLTVPVMYMVRP
jgi:hypothetical protein